MKALTRDKISIYPVTPPQNIFSHTSKYQTSICYLFDGHCVPLKLSYIDKVAIEYKENLGTIVQKIRDLTKLYWPYLSGSLSVHLHELGEVEPGPLLHLHLPDVHVVQGVDALASLKTELGLLDYLIFLGQSLIIDQQLGQFLLLCKINVNLSHSNALSFSK